MSKIEEAIERWVGAYEARDSIKSRLSSAECEVSNSITALGKALTPSDAVKGEIFCFPYREEFIQVEVLHYDNFNISFRPKKK